MYLLQVLDMSCGHCARAIKSKIADVDASAQVDVDLANRQVKVSSSDLDGPALAAAIKAAGFNPSMVKRFG
jgi:copper chaperone